MNPERKEADMAFPPKTTGFMMSGHPVAGSFNWVSQTRSPEPGVAPAAFCACKASAPRRRHGVLPDVMKTTGSHTPKQLAALGTLGLEADATPDDIRRAKRALVKSCHPDSCNGTDDTDKMAAVLLAAEQLLSDN